jgi:hypothetical protein
MRRFIIVSFAFLCFISLPAFSQNFRLNAGGSYSFFNNINERPVSFYGYGINYSYYFYKRSGLFISYDHYLPVKYYGLVPLVWYSPEDKIPVYITGGANSVVFGFRYKIVDPDSKRIEINTTIALSSFNHKGSYHIEETLIEDAVGNKVRSVYTGVELILKKGFLPLAISGGYNIVYGQNEYINNNFDTFSVPFSSSVVIKIGISLPVMKGPTPSQIKLIEF